VLRSTDEVFIHRVLEDAEVATRNAWVDWRRSDILCVYVREGQGLIHGGDADGRLDTNDDEQARLDSHSRIGTTTNRFRLIINRESR